MREVSMQENDEISGRIIPLCKDKTSIDEDLNLKSLVNSKMDLETLEMISTSSETIASDTDLQVDTSSILIRTLKNDDSSKSKKSKRKKLKKQHRSLKNNDTDGLQEDTLKIPKICPESNFSVESPVNVCMRTDARSELHNSEVFLDHESQQNEQEKTQVSLESNVDNYVSKVVDIDSTGEKHEQGDTILLNDEGPITYCRKKRKSSHSQNSSDAFLISGFVGNAISTEAIHEISGNVGTCKESVEVPCNCLFTDSALEDINQEIVMELNESFKDNFVKDMSCPCILDKHTEDVSEVKIDKVQIGAHHSSAVNKCLNETETSSLCEPLIQANVETKFEVSVPFSNSDISQDQIVIKKKEDHHPSPEKPLIGHSRKKLLILDVNGLLADIVPYLPIEYKADITIRGKAVVKRPFCDEFLQFCLQTFTVGVWSSRTRRNVEMVLDFLMGDSKNLLLFSWDQLHCTDTGFNTIANRDKPMLLKDLQKLWKNKEPNLPWEIGDYNESNTLLLDDSPYKGLGNPPYTAIFPKTYSYMDTDDVSLGPGGDLRVYLEGLAMADSVQKYVQQNPFGQRAITETNSSWKFYRRVLHSVRTSKY